MIGIFLVFPDDKIHVHPHLDADYTIRISNLPVEYTQVVDTLMTKGRIILKKSILLGKNK